MTFTRADPIDVTSSMETAMKKLFKLLSLLRLVAELRGRSRHGYRRSRDYYPLYGGPRRRSLLERALHRYMSRRSY
jgi:hypothetical protein